MKNIQNIVKNVFHKLKSCNNSFLGRKYFFGSSRRTGLLGGYFYKAGPRRHGDTTRFLLCRSPPSTPPGYL